MATLFRSEKDEAATPDPYRTLTMHVYYYTNAVYGLNMKARKGRVAVANFCADSFTAYIFL